ncbi:MoaD/ThiS family protein [[Eubacterium] cellulosolvens]
MRVQVKFYGVLKTAADAEKLELELEDSISVRHLVTKLVNLIARPEFEACLIDADLKDPRPNTLILVSGTEIGALNGIDTMLRDRDEVVFLPVAHGG